MNIAAMQVFFKPNDGYKDVFGVTWPLREDRPKVYPRSSDLSRSYQTSELPLAPITSSV